MEYRLIRSDRRTMAIEVEKDGTLLVRAPLLSSSREIEAFIEEHTAWIEKARARQAARHRPPLDEEARALLRRRAVEDLPARTASWAARMGIEYSGVTITSAQKRYGSCSSRGRISYSYRLMQFPEEVIDYVVVHELAHRLEMNHSSRFYAIVARYLPDYRARWQLLKTYPVAL